MGNETLFLGCWFCGNRQKGCPYCEGKDFETFKPGNQRSSDYTNNINNDNSADIYDFRFDQSEEDYRRFAV